MRPDALVLVEYRLNSFESAMEKVPDVCMGMDAYADKYKAVKDTIVSAVDKFMEQSNEHIMEVLKEARRSAAELERALAVQQRLGRMSSSHSGARGAFSRSVSANGFDNGNGDKLCRHFAKGRCTYGAKCSFKHEILQQPPQAFARQV